MKTENVLAERPCPITGGRDCQVVATRAREGHALRNVISQDSGLIYVDPLPIEDLSQFYKEDYRKAYKNVVIPKKKHIFRAGGVALARWGRLESYLPQGTKAIDFGAGGGEWAYLLKSRGVDVFGIEPNQGYGGFARENYDLNLFLGMYQEAQVERGSFGVATLFHVLEHLKDPVDDIRNMSAFLQDGGFFAIEVPDILYAGMHFDHKWHDGHLFGFDIKTLEGVVNRAGLHTVKLEKQGGNLFGIFQKRLGEQVAQPDLRGHCEEAQQEMEAGRTKYWLFPHTYFKVFGKVGRAIREKILVSSKSEGREILDSLYRKR
jgi:SAM-dependent methyltransferase